MFHTQDEERNTGTSAQPPHCALTEPNPRPGILLTLVCTVEHVPVGAEVLLVGSMFLYDEAHPTDEFQVEYRRALVTVKRCQVERRR